MKLGHAIRPITYLKHRTADLVREVAGSHRPVVITQHGTARVVVMDVETFDRWRESLALLKLVAQGEADVAAGRVVPQAEAFRRAEAAITRARRDA